MHAVNVCLWATSMARCVSHFCRHGPTWASIWVSTWVSGAVEMKPMHATQGCSVELQAGFLCDFQVERDFAADHHLHFAWRQRRRLEACTVSFCCTSGCAKALVEPFDN